MLSFFYDIFPYMTHCYRIEHCKRFLAHPSISDSSPTGSYSMWQASWLPSLCVHCWAMPSGVDWVSRLRVRGLNGRTRALLVLSIQCSCGVDSVAHNRSCCIAIVLFFFIEAVKFPRLASDDWRGNVGSCTFSQIIYVQAQKPRN